MSETVSPCNQLHRKWKKTVNDYSKKSISDFKLIVVYPSPKLTNQENKIIATSLMDYCQEQIIENNSKRIVSYLLKCWSKNKYSLHPSTNVLTPDEHVLLKIFSTELK